MQIDRYRVEALIDPRALGRGRRSGHNMVGNAQRAQGAVVVDRPVDVFAALSYPP